MDDKINKKWQRNTFPGSMHQESSKFAAGQGSDRGEWMHFFKVSPADSTFMLTGFDMGTPSYSTDGKEFQPLEIPHHRFSANASFSPHDGETAYMLYSHGGAVPSGNHMYGIWRTRDKGKNWNQIYMTPSDSYENQNQLGQNQIVEDPHFDRRHHIYFGSFQRGLMRSVDDGENWEVIAFPGRVIKTLSPVKGPDNKTVIYVIVGPEAPGTGNPPFNQIWNTLNMEKNRKNVMPQGELWRVEVSPEPPYTVQTFKLQVSDDDFVEVEPFPDNWSRGFIIKKPHPGGSPRGGKELIKFKDGGKTLGKRRSNSEANVRSFGEVHINPLKPEHVVIKSQAEKTNRTVQYSLDRGDTWNPPQPVQNGHVPDIVSYNPGSHKNPDGAKPQYGIYGHHVQGPSIGFDSSDPSVVYWWSQDYMKTPLKSEDYGQTWKPFAYGGTFKMAMQIAVGPDGKHRGIARGEYGYVTTRDGGLCWTGSTIETDSTLSTIEEKFKGLSSNKQSQLMETMPSWAAIKFGWGIGINPQNPDRLVAVYGAFPSLLLSKDGGLTWEETGDAGAQGSVYWHYQDSEVVYAADMKSEDGGVSWESLGRFVLAVSAGNGDIIVGQRKLQDQTLSLSTDRGESWVDLPPIPEEQVLGKNFKGKAAPLIITSNVRPASAVAIDPESDINSVRILVAGRSGVYEYKSDESRENQWSVLNKGFQPSIHFSRIEPVPWIGHVVFDPRPGFENVVYAAKSADPKMTNGWRGSNPNMKHPNGQAKKPLYRSLDGGKTWESLHGSEYEGIPEYLDVTSMTVNLNGTLYVDGYHGLYSLSGIENKLELQIN